MGNKVDKRLEEYDRELLAILAEEDPGEEIPHKYKSYKEEIRAELADEIADAGELGRGMKLPALLSREECQELITAYTSGKYAFRNNLVSRVLYSTGIRIEELENLCFCDIDYKTQVVFVRSGKGDKDRYACMDKETLEIVKTWQGSADLKEKVFGLEKRQLRRIVEKAGEITGISQKYEAMGRYFSPHSFSHAYATHSYENGMRVFTLKKLLGHEWLGTTTIYLYTAMKYEIEEYIRTGPLKLENK